LVFIFQQKAPEGRFLRARLFLGCGYPFKSLAATKNNIIKTIETLKIPSIYWKDDAIVIVPNITTIKSKSIKKPSICFQFTFFLLPTTNKYLFLL